MRSGQRRCMGISRRSKEESLQAYQNFLETNEMIGRSLQLSSPWKDTMAQAQHRKVTGRSYLQMGN